VNGQSSTARRSALAALVLLAAVLASYGLALTGEFVWDDAPLIVENSLVKVPAEYSRLFVSSFWETGDSHDRFRSFFRPLISLSYALDYAVWGLRPFGFHLTNLLLHFVCCWLVYRIAQDEGLDSPYALLGALVFAAHPVHVESVAWISGRTDLLCSVFVLASFLAYRRGVREPSRWRYRAGAWVLFLLSLFSKEMAATLPLLIFCDRYLSIPSPNGRFRAALGASLPFLVGFVLYFLVRLAVLGDGAPALYQLSLSSWMATVAFVAARYMTLLILPVGLDAHYPYSPLDGFFSPLALVSLLMLLVMAAGVWMLWKRAPSAVFWALWIVVGLLPVMTLGRFGDVIMADRFLYLPSVGLCLLVGFATRFLGRGVLGGRRLWVTMLSIVLVGPLAAASFSRSAVWASDQTLFTDMLKTSPGSALVRNNYGLTLYGRGELELAIEQFRMAVQLAPNYAMAHNNLGAALERRGWRSESLKHYRVAVDLAPGAMRAERNLGHLLLRVGQYDEGQRRLLELLELYPNSPDVLYAVADLRYRVGAVAAAVVYLEQSLSADPWHAESHYFLGKIRYEQGQPAAAAESMARFLDLWPEESANTRAARRIIADVRTASDG
jgi:tetratricopeptide (TPR) repeat protein